MVSHYKSELLDGKFRRMEKKRWNGKPWSSHENASVSYPSLDLSLSYFKILNI